MIDPVVALVGGIMFLAGLVVGVNWRLSGRRERGPLPLPDDWR